MKKINKKAFSKTEFMIMLAVIAILLAIGSKLALDSSENYNAFKTLANTFANSVAKYKDQAIIPKDAYTLDDVIKNGDSQELLNPRGKKEKCNKYESYVSVANGKNKTIKLVCGDYIVEAVQGQYYNVYTVSNWSEEKSENDNEEAIIYNYKENGELMLDEFVTKATFLGLYEEKTGTKISTVESVNSSGRELVSKQVYREKKLVKEMK